MTIFISNPQFKKPDCHRCRTIKYEFDNVTEYRY